MKRFIKCLCVVLAVACIIPISAIAADSVELAPVTATTTDLEESVAPRADRAKVPGIQRLTTSAPVECHLGVLGGSGVDYRWYGSEIMKQGRLPLYR